jgi:hypothetical protein
VGLGAIDVLIGAAAYGGRITWTDVAWAVAASLVLGGSAWALYARVAR